MLLIIYLLTFAGGKLEQTDPPSVAIIDLFPDAEGLEGEIMEYPLARDGYMFLLLFVFRFNNTTNVWWQLLFTCEQ